MRVYSLFDKHTRRIFRGGVPPVGERKPCPCGINDVNYPPPEQYWKNIRLDQGNFVSSILWAWEVLGVTGALKEALQSEGFDKLEFEPIEIVEDGRPSKDKRKLPLAQIPQFYRCKPLTSIPMHQDYIDRYEITWCPGCKREISKHLVREWVLDKNEHPGTDFFGRRASNGRYAGGILCSERGKAFLEAYPQTHCRFKEEEVSKQTMRVYYFADSCARRTLCGVVPAVGERKPCPCGINDVNYPPPEKYWKKIELSQGSFVSSILWAWHVVGVTGALKEALQSEGFDKLEFEPIEIVEDGRPSRDKRKLPLAQIPQFYRWKFLTFIPMHQDYIDRYEITWCPGCKREISKHLRRESAGWKQTSRNGFLRTPCEQRPIRRRHSMLGTRKSVPGSLPADAFQF